jgi:DNA polymerase bacteriophage-type
MLVGTQYPVMHGVSVILPVGDYETYSEAGFLWNPNTNKWEGLPGANKKRGLGVVGVYNYVLHPSFRVIQFAYDLKHGDGPKIWRPGMPNPTDLFDWVQSYRDPNSWAGLLEAWNVFFETTVWNLHCVPKHGWPPLYLDQVRCAMAKAARAGFPRKMEHAGPALKLHNLKDNKGKNLIKKLTQPRNPTIKNPQLCWTRQTAPEDFLKFDAYNVGDILTESEASIKMPDLCPRELKIWKVDQRINHRGMQLATKVIDDCLRIIVQAVEKGHAELREITHGAVKTHNQVKETRAWLRTYSVFLDSLDEEVVEAELLKNHTPAVRRVLEIRKSLSFGSVNKFRAMSLQVGPDGRLRDQYAFAAAHTDLWNGQNVQVVNLLKGKFNKPEHVQQAFDIIALGSLEHVERMFSHGPPWDPKDNEPMEALEVLAHCLRSVVIAGPGTRLMQSDYTAIQAVITAALAGERWQLDVFHTHGKIYEETAAGLTGKTLQYYLDYKKQTGKHHPDRQLYGKIPTLASGFGAWIGGWRNFDSDGILGDDAEVKKLVLATRAKIPNIVELWGGQTRNKFKNNETEELFGLEGAVIQAIKNPGKCYGYRGIRYQVYNDILYCKPPGDASPLIYHEPRITQSKRDYARPWEYEISYVGWNSNQSKGKAGWVRMPLYGGVCTQNIVAKIAREFQADALVELEDTGIYLPVMHTHDEIVCEVEFGRGTLTEYIEIVNRTQRPWAIDDWGRPWPIRAPGAEETPMYGKWD